MLTAIKTYFEVSNYSLANYVGLSESQIDAVRMGRRSLQPDHIFAFHPLEKALQQEIAVENLSGAQNYVAEEPKELGPIIQKTNDKLLRRRATLAKLQQHRHRALRGLHACQALLQLGTLTKHQKKWIQLRERHLRLRLEQYSIRTAIRLQFEIAGLEAQVNFLQNSLLAAN